MTDVGYSCFAASRGARHVTGRTTRLPHRPPVHFGMPIDPADTESDCIEYETWWIIEANVPGSASGSRLQTPPQYKYSTLRLPPPSFSISPARIHQHANLRKDTHRKDYHP